MTTEQEGAPSATAGGASAPILDLSAFEKAGRLLAAAWLEQQAARAAYWRGLLGGLSAEQESSATQEVDRSTCPNCWGDLPADPRDAEIERLRKEYDEVLVSGVLRETLCAEIERLRGELCRIRDIALVVLNVLPDDDDRSAVDLVRDILESAGPEKLRRDNQFRDLVAERDRKRRELADVTADRDDYADRLRATDAAYAEVTAERDLFRDALVVIKGAIGQTERLAAAITVDKREPRRWVAGDPEPEIGVTVQRTSVADYYTSWTRMPNGSWHPNHACRHEHADQCSGLVFAEWKQLPRPLVEVVGTDG